MFALKDPKIIIVTGPQGVGKSTLIKLVTQKENIYHLKPLSTKPSNNNSDSYQYIPWEEFQKKVSQENILASYFKNGNYYGFSKDELEKAIHEDKTVILKTTLEEALKVKNQYPQTFIVFISASLPEIRKRLKQKGVVSEDVLSSKLIKAKIMMDKAENKVDRIIVNEAGNPEKAAQEIIANLN